MSTAVQVKLIARIRQELPEIPLPQNPEFLVFRGRKDTGTTAWEIKASHRLNEDTILSGINEDAILSEDSMTTLVNAKSIGLVSRPNDYCSKGWEIGAN
jgi:hypothetical protein